MGGFGEMRGMSEFERDLWNGGYGPSGMWWMQDDEGEDECCASNDLERLSDESVGLKAKIEALTLYVQHNTGCMANDLDYLDHSPCTCGLRTLYNPKGETQ